YKVIGPPQLEWAISYTIGNKKGRVVANPKVMITNGETTTIELTSEYIDTVDAEIISNSNSGTITGIERTYNKGDDLGLEFELVPFISPEGYISLNLNASYSTPKDTVEAALGGGTADKELVATLLNERKIELNNVRVKDNETLLIGGLVQENENKNVYKVPFFGDIPVIGVLFRSTSHSREKSELIILLTPRIIKDTEDIGENQSDTL
ncbi:type II and III secretion system protein, partial [bacterium]|nr:type II and III secretion system protein [bacterium]